MAEDLEKASKGVNSQDWGFRAWRGSLWVQVGCRCYQRFKVLGVRVLG